MKKLLIILPIIFILCLLTLFTTHAVANSDKSNLILGSWKDENSKMEYFRDGTFISNADTGKRYTGTWSIEGNILRLQFINPLQELNVYTIIGMTDSTYKIKLNHADKHTSNARRIEPIKQSPVYATKNSRTYHKRNCPELNTNNAIRIFQYFSVKQLIGVYGNIEKKSADFKVRLPKGFKETLTKLEAEYNDEWAAFDQHTDGCTVYYGWVRGNSIGEYKLKLCEDYQTDLISIDFISLTRHGTGGMAISRYKDTQKTDKKAFLPYDCIRLTLKGKDKGGPFSVQVVGEVFDTGKMMVGSWDANQGAYGHYKGTLYGIRLDSVKTASASITDQSLYQTMINFNP